MRTAIIFDTEFLTAEGAPQRLWCGPYDPDPVIVQIGAIKLALEGQFEIVETFETLVLPCGRFGQPWKIDPHFTKLTGLTTERITRDGLTLSDALKSFDQFSEGAPFWSWGKDELNALAISCYLASIKPPIPATRFGNATTLMLMAGMEYEDIKNTRSNQLAGVFGLRREGTQAHDAGDDAYSVAQTLQYMLRQGRLTQADFVLKATKA